MRFDQINIINITNELVNLRYNKLDNTVIIGQLNLNELQLLLTVLKDIQHVQNIIFEAACINNTNIETIAHFIKDNMVNYEIYYQGEFHKCFLSIFILAMQLGQIIEEIPDGFRINRSPPKTLSFDMQIKSPKTIPEHIDNLELMKAPQTRSITPSACEADQSPKLPCLKHRQKTATESSKYSPPQKKVHFQDNKTNTSAISNDEIETPEYKKIIHTKCGLANELHSLICCGKDEEAEQYIEKLSTEDKQQLLSAYCAEEEFFGASILRLALRTNHILLIDILLKQGVDPFLCSQDGNTLLHDIILDIKPTALKILLKNISSPIKLQQLINLPFHGNTYNDYFALDIICIEATLHFGNFRQTIGERLANNIYSILCTLLNNNAQSKLLNDSKNNIKNYIIIDMNGTYTKKGLWNLISAIATEHEILTFPVVNIKYNPSNLDKQCAITLLAKQWQTNGILPAPIIKKPLDIKTDSTQLPNIRV